MFPIIKVSLYEGSCPYILPQLGRKIRFINTEAQVYSQTWLALFHSNIVMHHYDLFVFMFHPNFQSFNKETIVQNEIPSTYAFGLNSARP